MCASMGASIPWEESVHWPVGRLISRIYAQAKINKPGRRVGVRCKGVYGVWMCKSVYGCMTRGEITNETINGTAWLLVNEHVVMVAVPPLM